MLEPAINNLRGHPREDRRSGQKHKRYNAASSQIIVNFLPADNQTFGYAYIPERQLYKLHSAYLAHDEIPF